MPTDRESNDIEITWKREKPAENSSYLYDWDQAGELLFHPLDEQLSWPFGTHSILEAAFRQNLTRSTGWLISPADKKSAAVKTAAGYYKRGVSFFLKGEKNQWDTLISTGRYPIKFLPEYPLTDCSQTFTVGDAQVAALWEVPPCTTMTASEEQKNLTTVSFLLQAWQQKNRPPHWLIIGGGIVTDTAAFAATLAGCSYTLVPTTLLAMVDAAVGGKTGVNFPPYGKNQIGAFSFPDQVLLWPGWLQTLPPRSYRSGLAECFKHGLLQRDPSLLRQIAHLEDGVGLNRLLPALVRVKADIVQADPFENGLRSTLNLGHTLGHALEAYSQAHCLGSIIEHGEAVAVGLLYMLILSYQTNHLSVSAYQELLALLYRARILPPYEELASSLGDLYSPTLWPELCRLMQQDKKIKEKTADSLPFILLVGQGEAKIENVPLTTCWEGWQRLLSCLGNLGRNAAALPWEKPAAQFSPKPSSLLE